MSSPAIQSQSQAKDDSNPPVRASANGTGRSRGVNDKRLPTSHPITSDAGPDNECRYEDATENTRQAVSVSVPTEGPTLSDSCIPLAISYVARETSAVHYEHSPNYVAVEPDVERSQSLQERQAIEEPREISSTLSVSATLREGNDEQPRSTNCLQRLIGTSAKFVEGRTRQGS
jgi:hypothetical protein